MVRPEPQDPRAAPDGGWGWAVVAAMFVASALVFGLIRSLGVFIVEFVQHFEESVQAVSWITSIGLATQQMISPVGTALCNVYSARPVVMVGGFLSGLGFILASQATSLIHLYLTMGLVSGFGWALVFTPIIGSIVDYFPRRRSLALGLGFTGVGLSSFAFSPLFQLLVEEYSWRGALLIVGGLSLNTMACGALLRPLGGVKPAIQTPPTKAKEVPCSLLCLKLYTYLELSLLLHWPFLTYVLAVTLFNSGYYVPYVHLVAHSRLVGFSEYEAAFIVSAAGIADLVGRVVSGWVSDLGCMRVPHLLSLWTGLTGLSIVLLPPCSLAMSYTGLLLISLAYGFCAGAMTPLVFSAVPEIVGSGHVLGALGLLQLLESVGVLMGMPLSGWLKDQTGSYTASFLLAGGFLLAGTLLIAALPNYFSCSSPSLKPENQNQSIESGLLNNPVSSPTIPERA